MGWDLDLTQIVAELMTFSHITVIAAVIFRFEKRYSAEIDR